MVGFVGKFKSLAQQAQQKVAEVAENDQVKSAIKQVQQAQQKVAENDQVKSAIKQAQEKISEISTTAQTKWKEAQGNYERQQILKAATRVEKKDFPAAISILKRVPAKSEHYEDAQQKLAECVDAYVDYVQQVISTAINSDLINTATIVLKAIPEDAGAYQQAQTKAFELNDTLRQEIQRHKNLIPMQFENKTVAAAFVDQTVHIVSDMRRRGSIYSSTTKSSTYPDGEYLVVKLLARNDSKRTRTISASMMTLIDAQGREFQVSDKGQRAYIWAGYATAESFSTQLQPTLGKTITIIFDIPKGIGVSHLKVPSLSGDTLLPLSLAV